MVRENRPGSSRSCEGPKPWGRPKDRIYWPRYNRSTEAIMSEPIRQWFREKKVGSRASMAFAAVLLAQAQPASAAVRRLLVTWRLLVRGLHFPGDRPTRHDSRIDRLLLLRLGRFSSS